MLDEVLGEARADLLPLRLRETRPVLEGEVGERVQSGVSWRFFVAGGSPGTAVSQPVHIPDSQTRKMVGGGAQETGRARYM